MLNAWHAKLSSFFVFLTVVIVLAKSNIGPYKSLFGSSPSPWEPCHLEKKLHADTYPEKTRKHGCEIQRIFFTDHLRKQEKILENFTETIKKKFLSVLQRVEIWGKFNTAVPVLLTHGIVHTLFLYVIHVVYVAMIE